MIEEEKSVLSKYIEDNDYASVIDYCSSKIELDKSDYLFLGTRGWAYIEIEEYDKAITDLSQSIELNSEYVKGWFNRGRCYYYKCDDKLALVEFEKALLIEPKYSICNYYIGEIYACLENYEKSIEYFSAYLLDNKDVEVLKQRAELYYLTNQNEKASRDIAELLLTESDKIEEIESLNSARVAEFSNIQTIDETLKFSDIGFGNLQDEKCSGVYILEFNNDEYYIGKAKKIKTRIRQHNKNYSDIRTIYFKPVEEDSLLLEENKTISIFETNGLRIRNLKQIDFVNIFDEACQQRWINDLHYNKVSEQKFDNADVRESFNDRYLLFKEKPYFAELIQLLAIYFKFAIPNYLASEYNYWTITCLPNHLKKENCISRINLNAVPVLSIFEEKDKSLSLVIYASKLPYLRYLKQNGTDSFVNQISPFKFELREAFTEKTEDDEITLHLSQEEFKEALDNPLVLSSMRLFNLRMMNNVGKEITYIRKPNHCLDLADAIIKLLE